MAEEEQTEQKHEEEKIFTFPVEEAYNVLRESVEDVVKSDTPYQHERVGQWTTDVTEKVVRRLCALNLPFKYIVLCTFLQRNGAGVHGATACYWDNESDGQQSYRFEGKHMFCTATVYGIAM